MKRFIQHEFLKIEHFRTTEWTYPAHSHNHFEVIFIHKGKGRHLLNDMEHRYEGLAMFLLGPSDHHQFSIEEETSFTFLKFTNQYLKSGGGGYGSSDSAGWNRCMDDLIVRSGIREGNVLKRPGEGDTAERLMTLILAEWESRRSEANPVLFFLIQAVLAVIRRNLCPSAGMVPGKKFDEKIAAVLDYIHDNIYTPEKLQVAHLADVFSYSENYLGIFFKQQAGISLREYINRYKLSLIENRLKYSGLSLKEISYQMGFTDLSHFNHFYRKHKNISPGEMRKQFRKQE